MSKLVYNQPREVTERASPLMQAADVDFVEYDDLADDCSCGGKAIVSRWVTRYPDQGFVTAKAVVSCRKCGYQVWQMNQGQNAVLVAGDAVAAAVERWAVQVRA